MALRIRPSASTQYEGEQARRRISSVLDAFLDECVVRGREGLPQDVVQQLARDALGDDERAAVVIGALESEGVLIRERLYLGGQDLEDGFRIVFQAFSDFLILRRRLEHEGTTDVDETLRAWLQDSSWGIWEAAAIVLPETLGAELPDVLTPGDIPLRRSPESLRDYGRRFNVMRIFLEALPYRTGHAITKRTIELANQATRVVPMNEIYSAMFRVAPIPDHPLNALSLDSHLKRMAMPERDASFGFATYSEIWDESSPTATLGRWASKGPYPGYEDTVIELSCIPLIWLFSSPNRFQRDWITKALVQLLSGHLGVAQRLLERFWSVDDPYVIQRVLVVIYGALMRGGLGDRRASRRLARRVSELVFTRPVRADELLIDAGRGIVEWGIAHRLLPSTATERIERPYGIDPPDAPPSDSVIKRKYGRYDVADEKSYSDLYMSVLSMGDFGRYVIESGVRRFSRYRLGEELPSLDTGPARKPRFIRARWTRFVESLSSEQLARLEVTLRDQASAPGAAEPFLSTLSAEQKSLLDASWSRPRQSKYRDHSYPSDRAKRWVLQRAVGLGWRPKLFAREDRNLGYRNDGREAHKAERWGKKYQWMAYHELLARLADNYHGAPEWKSFEPYLGLHQIVGEREIDPSVPPIDYRGIGQSPAPSTFPKSPIVITNWPPARIDFAKYRGDVARFIADRATEPQMDTVLKIVDASDRTWIVLEASIPQGDPAEDKYWLGLQQPLTLQAVLTPRAHAQSLVDALGSLDKAAPWDLLDRHGHIDCCLHREIGWSPRDCPHFERGPRALDWDGETWQIVSLTERVTWEGSLLDCSTEGSVAAQLPSTFVHRESDLQYDERGPSWSERGQTVLTNYPSASDERGHAFLAAADWLSGLMERLEMDLVVLMWHQRWRVSRDPTDGEPWEEARSAGRMGPDLQIESAPQVRDQRRKRRRRARRTLST
ncbi:MAG: hypothetical protein K5799_15270 [Erythrobacter sp.]|nr:hypothetical protein [Erythrobacter sp.]